MLLDHVVIVEQPLAGGADVDATVGGGGEAGLRIVQDAAGPVQSGEERGAPPGAPGGESLALGQVLRAFGQVLGAEQLAADGPGEEGLGRVRAAGENTGEESGRSQRGNGKPREEGGTQCRAV
jgi:hypothetical protein